MEIYPYIKALHIIFVVGFFSGLFYLGKMFVYHAEAGEKEEPEKGILEAFFRKTEKRTWFIIVWPSFLGLLIMGVWLMKITSVYREGWFHFKLLFLLGLFYYFMKSGGIRRRLAKGTNTWSVRKLRFFNEVPAVFLVAIVFTVYLRNIFSGIWAVGVLIAFIAMIFSMIRFIKKMKKKKEKSA
jgi:putative membrane protein